MKTLQLDDYNVAVIDPDPDGMAVVVPALLAMLAKNRPETPEQVAAREADNARLAKLQEAIAAENRKTEADRKARAKLTKWRSFKGK